MARIENTSERQYDLTVGETGSRQTISIPAQVRGEDGSKINGAAEVDDAALATETRRDPVVKSWFDRGDLIQKTAPKAEPAKK